MRIGRERRKAVQNRASGLSTQKAAGNVSRTDDVATMVDPQNYFSSQTSSKRQPLKTLLTIILKPLTRGCQQVANRR